MDNKAQMYVMEAITIILIVIVAVYFMSANTPKPTVSHSIRLNQLETMGDDALRIADTKGVLTTSVINAVNHGEMMDNQNTLIKDLDQAISDVLLGSSYNIIIDGTTYYESSEPGEKTVTVHRIVINPINGRLYDFQLLMWYNVY